jgi:Flp pilus assembly protein TadG
MKRSAGNDGGNAVIETVLVVPALVVVLCFVVFVGRLAAADNDIAAAAKSAARAASLETDSYNADRAASDAAAASLQDSHVDCAALSVRVDVSNFQPGGSVRADVTCTVSLASITELGVPGSKTLSRSAVEVVDRFRSTP